MSLPAGLPDSKVCPRCKEDKPQGEYYVVRDRRRSAYKLAVYCKPCQREYLREYHQRKRQDPEWRERERERKREWDRQNKDHVREYKREWYHRARQRPEWVERRRAQDAARQRLWYRKSVRNRKLRSQWNREARAIRRDKEGGRPRASAGDGSQGGWLPIEPFREWLIAYRDEMRDPLADAGSRDSAFVAQVALALGLSQDAAGRRVRDWVNVAQHIPLDKADAVLTRLDSPARLYELWPELAEEAAA